jgi:hypothetical protein
MNNGMKMFAAILLGMARGVARGVAEEPPVPAVMPAAPAAPAATKKAVPGKITFVDGPYEEAVLVALAPAPKRRGGLGIPHGLVGVRSPEARSGTMELYGESLPYVLDSTTPGGGLTVLRLCWKGMGRLAEAEEVPLTSLTKEGNVFRCLFHTGFHGPRGQACLYGAVFWVVPTLPGRPTQVSKITYDVLRIRSAAVDFGGIAHWVAVVDANGNGVFNDPGIRQADGVFAGGDLVAVDLGNGDFTKPEHLEIQPPGWFFRVDGKLYQLTPAASGDAVALALSDCPLGGLVQKAPAGWRVMSHLVSEKGVSLADSGKSRELVAAGNWQLLSRRVQVEETEAWLVAVLPPPPPPPPEEEAAPEPPAAPMMMVSVAGGKNTVLQCPAGLRCQLTAIPSDLLPRQYQLQPRFFTADGLLVTDMRDGKGLPPRITLVVADPAGKPYERREFQWRQGVLLPLIWDASLTLKGTVSLSVVAEAKPFDVISDILDLELAK